MFCGNNTKIGTKNVKTKAAPLSQPWRLSACVRHVVKYTRGPSLFYIELEYEGNFFFYFFFFFFKKIIFTTKKIKSFSN